jgi:pyrimidine operon attenuation protein/uracil phosphoribosyltransferase
MTVREKEVLDEQEIRQKIKRIAYEIYERNHSREAIFFAGIEKNGYKLASLIIDEYKKISPQTVSMFQVGIDKNNPASSEVKIDADLDKLHNQPLIVVDDVINSASTIIYSLKAFLNINLKKIEVAVLVNRSHTRFPITPTYTGLEFATTLEDHIEVNLEDHNFKVLLK